MSDAKDQHEPSMEEILASIRRIISEDDEAQAPEGAADAAAAPAPAVAPAPAAAPAAPAPTASSSAAPAQPQAAPRPKLIADVEDDDVLLLTDEVADETAPPREEDSPLAIEMDEDDEPPPEPPRAPPREAESDPVFAAVNEPPPLPPPEPGPDPALIDDRLLSQHAAAASLAAMSELVTRSHREPEIESLPMGQTNQTLEDITRELLRPILKSWLDDNLPQIVERIVREEIGRLAIDAQRR